MTTTPNEPLEAPTPEPREEALVRIREEQRQTIVNLQGRLNEVEAKLERWTRAGETIADALREEAISRDWCAEYEEFIERVNAELPAGYPRLQPCWRTYHVTFDVNLTEEQVTELENDIDRILPQGVYVESYQFSAQ